MSGYYEEDPCESSCRGSCPEEPALRFPFPYDFSPLSRSNGYLNSWQEPPSMGAPFQRPVVNARSLRVRPQPPSWAPPGFEELQSLAVPCREHVPQDLPRREPVPLAPPAAPPAPDAPDASLHKQINKERRGCEASGLEELLEAANQGSEHILKAPMQAWCAFWRSWAGSCTHSMASTWPPRSTAWRSVA